MSFGHPGSVSWKLEHGNNNNILDYMYGAYELENSPVHCNKDLIVLNPLCRLLCQDFPGKSVPELP
jgi:hypothetical protein